MILKLILMAALSIGTVASVWAAPPEAQQPVDVAFEVEALRLREALVREVRGALRPDPARDAQWIDLARAETTASNMVIDRPQLVVVVDRNPRVQALMVVLALPQGDWKVIGGSRVSTGQRGRFDHYVTPTGVFHLTDAILGYRAEGTLNENGIRGLGAKGMRVWDFGWHVAMKGWTEVAGKPDRTPIRLMLHATDPDKLEQRIGRPASQGCIRIPTTMNRFLDRHGVLDAEYERAAVNDIRFRALLLRDRDPSPAAGNTLIVVDSAERTPIAAIPVRAISN
ncbi:MAG TPA: L,D-transpeptidase [Acetobacteraceae bacterium]|nr:L,D-transpeptidase [Acetobacteraceae bacterium]